MPEKMLHHMGYTANRWNFIRVGGDGVHLSFAAICG